MGRGRRGRGEPGPQQERSKALAAPWERELIRKVTHFIVSGFLAFLSLLFPLSLAEGLVLV